MPPVSDLIEIALIADLHGNLPATEALDADLRQRGIRHIYCLGDVVGKGTSSAETFDWAFSRCEVLVQGNWDSGIGKKLFPNDQFYYDQLGPERMKKLCEMPLEHSLILSGRRIRLFHGRPVLRRLLAPNDESTLLSPLFDPDYQVVGYADIHKQGLRMINGRGILFNTGAVGNGLGLNMVQYALLRGSLTRADAPLDISFVTLPYDQERAIRDAENTKALPNWHLYKRELETGIYSR